MAFIPTLCEVSYDSDLFEKDRYLTPYRIPQLRNLGKCYGCGTTCRKNGFGFDRFSSHRHGNEPSYYDYLKNYYLEQTRSPNDYGGSIPSPSLPSRSHTTVGWYVPIDNTGAAGNRDNHPAGGSVSFPQVLKTPTPCVEERGEWGVRDGDSSRLVWVDALSAWVPDKQLQDKNYLSFVNTPPIMEKYFTSISREAWQGESLAPCGRFQTHMTRFRDSSPSRRTGPRNLRRAAALQRKPGAWSPENGSESRKHNRKAYSTPLSNAENRRKHLAELKHQHTSPEPVSESPAPPPLPIHPAWAHSHSPSGEEEEGEALEGDHRDRLDLAHVRSENESEKESSKDRSPEVEVEGAAQSGRVDRDEDQEEVQTTTDTYSSDYQHLPPIYLRLSPPLLDPSPIISPAQPDTPHCTPAPESVGGSSESGDSMPTLPSVSIQYIPAQPHFHTKSVHFPQVVATDIVELEPMGTKVPYRLMAVPNKPMGSGDKEEGVGQKRGKDPTRKYRITFPQLEDRRRDEVVSGASDHTVREKLAPDRTVPGEKGRGVVPPQPSSQLAPAPPVRHKPKTAPHAKKSPRKTVPRSSRSSQSPGKSGRTPRTNKPPPQHSSASPASPPRQSSKHKMANKKSPSKAVKLDKQPPSRVSSQDEDRPQPLPVSLPIADPQPPSSPLNADIKSDIQLDKESEKKTKGRTAVKKRERVTTTRRACKSEEVEEVLAAPPEVEERESVLVYEQEEVQTQIPVEVKVSQPTLPPVVPSLPTSTSQSAINRVQKKLQAFRQPLDDKKRWGPRKRDTSYEDELRKQEIAEARRKRQAEMLDRMKKKRFNQKMEEDGITGIPSFEDYGFLAKYCILSRANLEMYKHTFQAVDDERRGWLSGTDAMIALRGTNNQLTETEEEYLYRILELTGYNISSGADFKLFSVLAALSQRISSLDTWMKNLIGRVDFKTLEMKMFMCKNLWECNVDKDSNKIPLKQLMIELRAGGVSEEHEWEVREKLGHLQALDLLDFLTYIPLFIMIHQSVVLNPLDDTRYK